MRGGAAGHDGGICTRVDCVSRWVCRESRRRTFYDEAKISVKRYAIWGAAGGSTAGTNWLFD